MWALILVVWNLDGSVQGGKFMETASEEICWTQAKQDTDRIKNLYPGQQFRWVCVGPEVTEPEKENV